MFVLDTNTVIDYFKGRGKVAQRLLAVPPREIALPAIAAYEVWVGVLGSQNAKRRQSPLFGLLRTTPLYGDRRCLHTRVGVCHRLRADFYTLQHELTHQPGRMLVAVVNYEQAVEPFIRTNRLSDSERAMLMGPAPRLMGGR